MTEYRELTHTYIDDLYDEEREFTFSFKKPKLNTASQIVKKMTKDPLNAYIELCEKCVLPEQKESMLAAFNKDAGLPSTFGANILKSCGFGELGNA